METLEILKNSKVEGNIIKLPQGQLDRQQYLEVKKKLELIGGKWKGGKVMGFVFEEDPTDLEIYSRKPLPASTEEEITADAKAELEEIIKETKDI